LIPFIFQFTRYISVGYADLRRPIKAILADALHTSVYLQDEVNRLKGEREKADIKAYKLDV